MLQAVLDQPDDTELRRVYADWLEERGEIDRATLIRVQCDLHGVPKHDYRWIEHWIWLADHRDALAPPPLPAGLEWDAFTFRRGFPERVRAYDGNALLANAGAMFAAAPVRALQLDARAADFPLDRLLAAPWLARITRLHFQLGRFGADAIRRIGESPHLGNVTELGFSFAGITADGLDALLATDLVRRLTRLVLDSNFFIEYGRPLAAFRGVALPALRRLDLRGNRIDAPVLAAITEAELALDRLNLHDNPLGNDGWRVLAAARPYRGLDLGKTRPQLPGVRALAASQQPSSLRVLKVDDARLGPTAAVALAGATWPVLEFLDLAGNQLGERGETALVTSSGFPVLRRADIRDHRGPFGARARAWFESTERMRALSSPGPAS